MDSTLNITEPVRILIKVLGGKITYGYEFNGIYRLSVSFNERTVYLTNMLFNTSKYKTTTTHTDNRTMVVVEYEK